MQEWAQLIAQLGFPIVCVIGMAWYIANKLDKFATQIQDLFNQQLQEMQKLTQALLDEKEK